MEVETVHPLGSDESATTRSAQAPALSITNRHTMAGVSAPIALRRAGGRDSREVTASVFCHF